MLQCVTCVAVTARDKVCCSVLQSIAVCYRVLLWVDDDARNCVCLRALQCVEVCCSVLRVLMLTHAIRCVAVCCNVL